ncbi:hypothetical protein [Nostoc linckia]|uniref:hypothetical protein n=1 Tax=Nostoc linckia TaxID=92942 RepID=UPI0015D503B6|nr:hypothetical protein [Nostoc linckia]
MRRCADNTDIGGAVPPWWIFHKDFEKQCKPYIDAQWLACQQASPHSAFTGLRSLPP